MMRFQEDIKEGKKKQNCKDRQVYERGTIKEKYSNTCYIQTALEDFWILNFNHRIDAPLRTASAYLSEQIKAKLYYG